MPGKSAAIIMRRIQPDAMAAARKLALDEACDWLASLRLHEAATHPSLLQKLRDDAAAGSVYFRALNLNLEL